MPHFVVEYSRVIEEQTRIDQVMESLFEASGDTDVLSQADVKIRAIPFDHYRLRAPGETFAHVTVFMLHGRTDAQKAQLAVLLRSALADVLPTVTSVSVDIRDMNPVAYKKRLLS